MVVRRLSRFRIALNNLLDVDLYLHKTVKEQLKNEEYNLADVGRRLTLTFVEIGSTSRLDCGARSE